MSTERSKVVSKYKKRIGTQGLSGQLYETKLLSLIAFRAEHDDNIEEFYIGSNVEGLGYFDDISIKLKSKELDKPVAVFLQARHRENYDRILSVKETDLVNYFESYLKIRNKFKVTSSDPFFKCAYEDVECAFVLYTNSKYQIKERYNINNYIKKINNVICTDHQGPLSPGFVSTSENVKLLNQIYFHKKLKQIATVIVNIISQKKEHFLNLMMDESVQEYHVFLAQNVFNISEVNPEGYRIGTFREDFFVEEYKATHKKKDEHLLILKDLVFYEVVKGNKPDEDEILQLLALLFYNPCVETIAPLIGGTILYNNNNGRFQFVYDKMSKYLHLTAQLERVTVLKSDVEKAVQRAATTIVNTAEFWLPPAFGNIDLALRGNSLKKEKRLSYIATKLLTIMDEAKRSHVKGDTNIVVIIDDGFHDKGFLQVNGGLASAVGNLLILDEDTTLLKFAKCDDLRDHARILFEKLNMESKDLERYRFHITVKHFPLLTLDCNEHEKGLVKDFMSKFLIYSSQASEFDVERILKWEVAHLKDYKDKNNFDTKLDAVFLTYHDEIQKWWMQPNGATYLTETSQLFEKATDSFRTSSLLTSNAYIFRKKLGTNSYVRFCSQAIESLESQITPLNVKIIVSEVVTLTVFKVAQIFEGNDYILLDLNYVVDLPAEELIQIITELKDLSVIDRLFLVTYNCSPHKSTPLKDLYYILQALRGKKLIVVTNDESLNDITEFFSDSKVITDKNIDLIDFSYESQTKILANTNAIFQGNVLKLRSLIDDDCKKLVKGPYIMNQIMKAEMLILGKTLTNANYENIKDFYVSRVVAGKPVKDDASSMDEDDINDYSDFINLETFYDIHNHCVLVTGGPGMGKSTLLTDLSLKTKSRDPGVWILRINLLDYSRIFYQWKENNVVIDLLETLRFICMAVADQKVNDIMSNENIALEDKNGVIFVSDCTALDEATLFELNIFLHYLNQLKVIFLFDGFDEICPHYETVVIRFLKVLKSYHPDEVRFWITSRNYNQIILNLEEEFGDAFQLQPWSIKEQDIFIERFFLHTLNLIELNNAQINKVNDFFEFMINVMETKKQHSSQFCKRCSPEYSALTIPMYRVYLAAINNLIQGTNELYFEYKDKYLKVRELYNNKTLEYNEQNVDTEIAIPLHLYLIVDYFRNEIKDTDKVTKWDLSHNTYAMFERFKETKIKKILFEDKNKMDLYKPLVQAMFEKERDEFLTKHKKLAVYMIFYDDVKYIFSKEVIKEIQHTINLIKLGKEKSGLIDCIVDDRPRFVHRTFAEYLAIEYFFEVRTEKANNDDLMLAWINLDPTRKESMVRMFNDKMKNEEMNNLYANVTERSKTAAVILCSIL